MPPRLPRARSLATAALALALAVARLAEASTAAAGSRRGEEARPGFAETVRALERREGLLVTYLDREKGRVWLELPPAADERGVVAEYLYVEGLTSGLGSNPVGLDRGQLGDTRLVALRRVGGRLLVEEINVSYRALSDREPERRAVRESFATSVLWAGPLTATASDGRALVDFTPFVVRDAHGVVAALRGAEQGDYQLDAERSALDPAACLAFPDNLEFEGILTFAGKEPGGEVRQTAPDGTAVTLRQHHSLVRLPAEGFRPRPFDPRSGSFAIRFHDYAAPLAASLERRWIVRHRLEKVDREAARSPVKAPIVYYVDPGAPPEIQAALLEGAGWWAEAFAAAGFDDAFRVEVLPEDVHPLDVRYNVIQWVHRATRGWSYGGGVVDPRTGERIKGHVSLGSLRVRQDRLLFEGLVGRGRTGSGAPDDPLQLALARIRQLAAHEVGHTLGLAHNFAASSYGRASVMDYPAPLVTVGEDGTLDVSRAYATGVGAWDVQAILYAYAKFPPGTDEEVALDAIVRDGLRRGLLFLSDPDARPVSAAHPRASLWDNGENAVDELESVRRVRRAALERFGPRNLAPGLPLTLLQEALAPVYLYHRFQVVAASKAIGGLEYHYALVGEDGADATPVAPEQQRRALASVLSFLDPGELDLPEELLARLLPRAFGYEPNREIFGGWTAPVFDPLAAAASAADVVLGALLDPARAARLVDQHRRRESLPGLEEALEALWARVSSGNPAESSRHLEIRRAVEALTVRRLLDLAASPAASPAVRALTEASLEAIVGDLEGRAGEAHERWLAAEISRHQRRWLAAGAPGEAAPPAPPGEPIGSAPSADEPGCSWGSRGALGGGPEG